VVQIDIDPLELGRSYGKHARPDGRSQAALTKLLIARDAPARDTSFAERARGIVAAWQQARAPLLASDAAPILPDRLCAEITAALPEDGILVADTGYSGIWTAPHRAERQPHRPICAQQVRWGGRPASLGAKMCRRQTQGDLLVGRRRDLITI